MTTENRRYHTVATAAKLLHVSPSTVWRWTKAGRLPAQRLGPKTIRIVQEDLLTLQQPARPQSLTQSMTLEQARNMIHQPPTAEELARREAVIERTLAHRKDLVITPLTTADLIHQAREEEYRSYGGGR